MLIIPALGTAASRYAAGSDVVVVHYEYHFRAHGHGLLHAADEFGLAVDGLAVDHTMEAAVEVELEVPAALAAAGHTEAQARHCSLHI